MDDLNAAKTIVYEFGGFRLIPSERLLFYGEDQIALSPKVFDSLVVLVENHGRLVEKDELLEMLWADTFVEEATLARTISRLRKTLRETANAKYIETVAKSGYRFTAPVEIFEEDSELIISHSPDSQIDKIKPDLSEDEEISDENKISGKPDEHKDPLSEQWFSNPRLWLFPLGLLIVVSIAVAFIWQTEKPDINKITAVRSIAVLPFRMLNGNEEERSFGTGMAETLSIKLNGINQIIVRPSSAVSKFADRKDLDLKAVGRELQVDATLNGTIQKDGEKLRVTVQLINSVDGTSLWSDKFDARSSDIFAMQDDISTQVVQTLRLELTGEEQKQLAKRYTENPEAYQAYIQGRYLWGKRNAADLQKSLSYFEKAIELDPNYALAHTGVADCFLLFGEYRIMPVVESNAKARTAAQKALAIDETLAEAHASLAYTLAFYDWNWEAAEREFKRAIELNPNYATAYQWYFEYLTVMGRFDEGWVAINKALELDPSSPPINGDVATYYYLTRQNDKTIEQARKLIELEPNYPYGYIFLFLGFYEKGMQDEAVEAFLRMEKLFYDQEETTVNELKEAYEKSGWKGFWQKRIEIMDRDREKKLYLAWDYIVPYIDIGEKEKAIQAFQQSYKDRDRWIVNLKYLPQFDPIRSDPRFQEIVRKIGLE